MAQAADNAPLSSTGEQAERRVAVGLLRRALQALSAEFEEVIKLEREKVKRLGGLYVIGEHR